MSNTNTNTNSICPFCGKDTISWYSCWGCGATPAGIMMKRELLNGMYNTIKEDIKMTLAGLFLEASRVAEMIEGTGIDIFSCIKRNEVPLSSLSIKEFTWGDPEDYKFAQALVEGKQVFKDDKLYNSLNGSIFLVDTFACNARGSIGWKNLSWNQPKPKTIMVEHSIEVAEWLAQQAVCYGESPHLVNAGNDCCKALGELK